MRRSRPQLPAEKQLLRQRRPEAPSRRVLPPHAPEGGNGHRRCPTGGLRRARRRNVPENTSVSPTVVGSPFLRADQTRPYCQTVLAAPSPRPEQGLPALRASALWPLAQIGRASCRERVCQYV